MPDRLRDDAAAGDADGGGSWLACGLVVLGVVVLTTGPLYRIRSWWDFDDPLADDPAVVAVQAIVALLAVVVLVVDGRWRRVDPVVAVLAVALVGWLVLSTAWSLDRATTARESLQIGGTLAAGAAAASTLSALRLLWCSWAGLQVGLAWSAIAIALTRPGTQDINSDWTGIFFNRNSLGLWAALGLLLSILLLIGAGGQPRRTPVVGASTGGDALLVLAIAAVADVILIAGSDALTPLVAVLAALGSLVAARAGRSLVQRGVAVGPLAAIAGAVSLVLGSVLWAFREQIVELTGRDADLTGRSDLWRVSLDWAWKRPLAGYGYLAAWQDREFRADVREARGRALSSAHNSFVEVLLGAGILALVLLLALVVVLYLRAATDALTSTGTAWLWPLGLLVFVVVENLTETLFVGNHLTVAVLGALGVTRVVSATAGTDRPGLLRAPAGRGEAADPTGRR